MDIATLVGSNNGTVKDLIATATRYRMERDRGEITYPQYDRLCSELLDLDAIRKRADAADMTQEVVEAVEFLMKFVKL